jgi:phage shock protein PspC (stress-responsive transcriptional regulator)
MILGVSPWVGEKINMPLKQVRLLFVVTTFLAGVGLTLYLVFFIVKFFQK